MWLPSECQEYDDPARIVVGVVRVDASDALEYRLVLAVSFVRVSAHATGLGCVGGVDECYVTLVEGSFLLDALAEHAPVVREDASVQSGFRRGPVVQVLSGVFRVGFGLCAAGHAFGFDVLQGDDRVVEDEPEAEFFHPVLFRVCKISG